MNNNLSELIVPYLEYAYDTRNLKASTIAHYKSTLNRFLSFCQSHYHSTYVNVEDIDIFCIQAFIKFYKKCPKSKSSRYYSDPAKTTMSINTVSWYVTYLRRFLRRCAGIGLQTTLRHIVEPPRKEKTLVPFLTEDELWKLFALPRSIEKVEETKIRNEILLKMWYSGGLRIQEALDMRFSQINGNEVTIQWAKTGTFRTIILTDNILSLIKVYQQVRMQHDGKLKMRFTNKWWWQSYRTYTLDADAMRSDRVFVSHDPYHWGAKMTHEGVTFMLHRYAKALNLRKPLTFHMLRHTFATNLIKQGVDLCTVQAMMGHASITSTQIYTHISSVQMQLAHSRIR